MTFYLSLHTVHIQCTPATLQYKEYNCCMTRDPLKLKIDWGIYSFHFVYV